MAVAPASMADMIIILDEDGEESPPQPFSSTAGSSRPNCKNVKPLRAQQPAPTHITQSPFASAKKQSHVLQAENERLFTEFVEHCTPLTQDCPEVITFLKTKHSKASPSFLSSVEFRNTLGRCLTRAQTNRSKTFVYINELCTVLRQHGVKKRQNLTKPETSTSASFQFSSVQPKKEDNKDDKAEGGESNSVNAAEDEKPSTSDMQEDSEAERKAQRKSRKQIAYLENLLKVYNDEIHRLQEAELTLDDLGTEDSLYIQEHKLKRKMMKIYEKLCEIKGCDTLTGRVSEQRIMYNGSRYPEINKRIERFINSPGAQMNPPDYQDILQQVLRANERYNLCLSRKQLNEIAKEAFRETASRIQDRRQLDLVYNFGSHLTDQYKPATDPALADHSLMKKLRSNREVALTRLEDVITKYSNKQEDTEEQERAKRSEKGRTNKELRNLSKKGKETTEVNGVNDEEEVDREEDDDDEEEDDDEEDQSSDPDIDEELEASTQQDGPEGVSEEDESNEAEQVFDDADKDQLPPSVSPNEEDEDEVSELSPLSQQSKSVLTPMSSISSPRDSPSQLEPVQTDDRTPLTNGASTEPSTEDTAEVPGAANGVALCPTVIVGKFNTPKSKSPPLSPRATRSQKRKREEMTLAEAKHTITCDSDVDISLDMGVFSCDSPPQKLTGADTPPHNLVSSSQSTPPPKKNKVNVATQCDPQEVIVLSDSE